MMKHAPVLICYDLEKKRLQNIMKYIINYLKQSSGSVMNIYPLQIWYTDTVQYWDTHYVTNTDDDIKTRK